MRLRKKRPGHVAARTQSTEASASTPDHSVLTRNANQSLAVELRSAGETSAAERELIALVMSQLSPLATEPRIMVLLMPPRHPVEWDAQNVANDTGEPVAICDMEGKLLAFSTPRQH
jgi:hypothetical protein